MVIYTYIGTSMAIRTLSKTLLDSTPEKLLLASSLVQRHNSENSGEPLAMTISSDLVSIRVVEQETGLSKDVLRIWEKRYGFPLPQRTELGERLYEPGQIERLKAVKKLVDSGMRPGSVIKLDDAGLAAIAARTPGKTETTGLPEDIAALLELLSGNNSLQFKDFLLTKLIAMGVRSFVVDFMAPLNHAVGDAWFTGQTPVFREHYYSNQIQGILATALALIKTVRKPPRVVLATITGEQHVLSLIMVEILLALEGATCIQLGPQVPYNEIISAAEFYSADIVALSFSSYYPQTAIKNVLKKLAADLPQTTEIWVGGGSVYKIGATATNVRLFSGLEQIPQALEGWR
jgi:methanogenic corrinoid protein MtbC1